LEVSLNQWRPAFSGGEGEFGGGAAERFGGVGEGAGEEISAAALGVGTPVFPFTVFTDSHGEVVALFIGELHKPQAELILAEVQNLNKGLVQLAAARRTIAAGLRALKPR
jgi:hypothetical protein